MPTKSSQFIRLPSFPRIPCPLGHGSIYAPLYGVREMMISGRARSGFSRPGRAGLSDRRTALLLRSLHLRNGDRSGSLTLVLPLRARPESDLDVSLTGREN